MEVLTTTELQKSLINYLSYMKHNRSEIFIIIDIPFSACYKCVIGAMDRSVHNWGPGETGLVSGVL